MDALLVSDVDAARLIGISRARFHELLAEGMIGPKVRIGRRVLYDVRDVRAFCERLVADAREVAALSATSGGAGNSGSR